jgi:hypothetical protein
LVATYGGSLNSLKDSAMRIEFLPDGSHDGPAILFYGCPSAGAEALINTLTSLADGQETEVALHQLPGLTPVGEIQVFATNAKGCAGVQQLSAFAFRWRQDREGWREATELAEPVAQSNPSEGTKFQYLERNGRVNVIFATDRAW